MMPKPRLSRCVSALCNSDTAMGTPINPPTISSRLPSQRMLRRSAHRLVACTPMLQAIINGTASSG
jgi:hypothetical protein